MDISGAAIADVDEPKLERIVENLVLNAAKHTPERRRFTSASTCRATISSSRRRRGAGPDEYKTVFETFNRGPKMLSTTPGLGIGLALVARFAEVHGGRTWVEDRDGRRAPSASSSRTACVRPAPPAGS